MSAITIRDNAFKILEYACVHCDSSLKFVGRSSDVMQILDIENYNDFHMALAYIRTSKMVIDANYITDEFKIDLLFNAINRVINYKKLTILNHCLKYNLNKQEIFVGLAV